MKILIIAYEGENQALSDVARELEKEGHETRMLQGDPTCVTTLPWILKPHYESGYIKQIETMQEALIEFINSSNNPDWRFLRRFEKEYCTNKNLLQLGMTDPIIFDHHHYRRPYYTSFKSWIQPYTLMERLLKWIENCFINFNPDILFTIDRNYFVKNAAAVIAQKYNCHIACLAMGRVEGYWFFTTDMSAGFRDLKYKRFLEKPLGEINLDRAHEQINKYLENRRGLYESDSQRIAHQEKLIKIHKVILELFEFWKKSIKNFLKVCVFWKKESNLLVKSNYLKSYWPKVMIYRLRIAVNKIKYAIKNPFVNYIPEGNFLLFPLHTLPESSTLTLSTEYYEDDLIHYISKELPAGMRLVVKENPNMVGERFWSFYKDIKKLPNVILVDPMVPTFSVIDASKGTVGISGTVLLEGVLMGKPSHCFGHPEFLPVVNSYGYSNFSKFAADCLEENIVAKKEKALRHIQYVLDNGAPIDIKTIRKPGSGDNTKSVKNIVDLIRKEILFIGNAKKYNQN